MAIQLQQIAKGFGDRVLFRDSTIHLPHRGIVVLVGANGTGKSTLMRIMVGQESLDEGQVIAPRDLKSGYLSQEVETEDCGTVLNTALSGYQEVLALEQRLTELSAQIGEGQDERTVRAMADAQEEFDRVEGYTLKDRAATILHGLGFDDQEIAGPFASLSGGWRMRVVLARLLLEQPQLLLLDEPTNHLDIDSIIWLENMLQTYQGTVLLTSHDRTFTDRIAEHILAIDGGRVSLHPGNYTRYVKVRKADRERLEQQISDQQKKRSETEQFIARFRAKATKAKQVQSRIKQLEREEPLQSMAAWNKKMSMRIAAPPRSPKKMVDLNELHMHFGDNHVFNGVNWHMLRGQKVALVGPNGSGKSTLIKLIAGELAPTQGEVRIAESVEIGYFAQHQLDVLNPKMTVLEALQEAFPELDQSALRSMLGSLLFSGNDVDKKIAVLSGGEKARVSLAKLLLKPSNILLLDEPTNHLDLESREVMAAALKGWPGSLIVVSHDRTFLNGFVDTVIALTPGAFSDYPGNTEEYEWHLKQREGRLAALLESEQKPAEQPSDRKKTANAPEPGGGKQWKERKKVRGRYQSLSRQLQEAEAVVAEVLDILQNPDNAADHALLIAEQRRLQKAKTATDELLVKWEAVVEEGLDLGLDLLEES